MNQNGARMRLRSFRSRAVAAVAVASVACLMLVGCSSSSNNSNNNGSTGASSSSFAAKVATAKKQLAQVEVRPTKITLTTPIGKPVPTGKTIAYINCGAPACTFESGIIKQAASTLGWTEQVLNTDGTPQQVDNAWAQVIREKPFGVIYEGFPRSEFNQQILKASAEGIFVSGCCNSDSVGNGIDYYIDGNALQAQVIGPILANWATAQSNGQEKPAVVYLNVPEYTVLTAIGQTFKSDFTADCPGCSFNTLNLPLTSIGSNAPTLIVSYLRSHPNVKYVVGSIDSANIGLPAALKAAGLTDVKVFGVTPTTINLGYIAAGQESGTVTYDYYEIDYALVDAIARKAAGVPIQPGFTPPPWVLTEANLPSATQITPVVPNIQTYFAHLWGKS
jgi:ribose transport system substrate-binding protein